MMGYCKFVSIAVIDETLVVRHVCAQKLDFFYVSFGNVSRMPVEVGILTGKFGGQQAVQSSLSNMAAALL